MLNNYNAKQIHILDFAAPEFLNQGYMAASTNTIAKSAKVAKGLIFHYFRNKENLYKELLQYAFVHVKSSIDSQLLSLSTYMEPFELIKELILIKENLYYDQPVHTPLLINSFMINTELSVNLKEFIMVLEKEYQIVFSSFLNDLYLQERLRMPFKNDPALFTKLMLLLETAFMYEKSLLISPTLAEIKAIDLSQYETLLKKGLILSK